MVNILPSKHQHVNTVIVSRSPLMNFTLKVNQHCIDNIEHLKIHVHADM